MRLIQLCVLAIAALVLSPTCALAQSDPATYECDLSGVSSGGLYGCVTTGPGNPAGTNTVQNAVMGNTNPSNPSCSNSFSAPFCGARADGNLPPIVPIDAYGICRWITNNSGNPIFVPFRASNEWSSFLSNAQNITAVPCSLPFSETGTLMSVQPPYASCGGFNIDTPNVYGQGNGTSYWPSTPTLLMSGDSPVLFTCHNGITVEAGQYWQAVFGSPNGSWNPQFTFSPDVTLTAQDTTTPGAPGNPINITTGDQVVLNWTALSTSGTVASFIAYSNNPSSNWSGKSGTSPSAKPLVTTTYTVAVTDNHGLVSTASVTVYVGVAGQCGIASVSPQAATPIGSSLCAAGNSNSNFASNASGWTWTCTAISDGSNTACTAYQTAQCNGSATVDNTGVITGSPCTVGSYAGTASVAGATYSYICTAGGPSNTTTCTGSVASSCLPGP